MIRSMTDGLQPLPSLDGVRVLVVDDRALDKLHVTRVLENARAEVVQVGNGAQALGAVELADREGKPFDVVLMDVQMPVMDGHEATRRLRGMAQGRELPIIALTAGEVAQDREHARLAGMSGFIAKPVNQRDLLEQIRQAVDIAHH